MANKLIEFVCDGNKGRSPVAEVIANDYLRAKLVYPRYQAISSGTSVTQIKDDTVPISVRLKIIEVAKQRELYAAVELEVLGQAIEKNDTKLIKHFYDLAVKEFSIEEDRFRRHIPPALGIDGFIDGLIKDSQEQTMARPHTIGIFSMTEQSSRKVHKIYNASYYQPPVIDVLSRYATANPEAEIPNTFGMPIETYIAFVRQLDKEVPMAIDKLLMEHKH